MLKKSIPQNRPQDSESIVVRIKRFSVVFLFFLLAVIFAFGVLDVDLFRSSTQNKVLARVNGRSLVAAKDTVLHELYQQSVVYYENSLKRSVSQEERDILLQQAIRSLVDHYSEFDYATKLGYSFDSRAVLSEFVQFTKSSMGITKKDNTLELEKSIIAMISSGNVTRSAKGRKVEKYLQELSTIQIFEKEYFGFFPVSMPMVNFMLDLYAMQKIVDLVVVLRASHYENFVGPQELETFKFVNKSIYEGKSSNPTELKNLILVDFINANTKELTLRMNTAFSQMVESLGDNPSLQQVSAKFSVATKRTRPFGVDSMRLVDTNGAHIEGVQREEIQSDLFSLSKNSPIKLFFFKDAVVWAKMSESRNIPRKKSSTATESIVAQQKKLLKNQFLKSLQESSTISYSKYSK